MGSKILESLKNWVKLVENSSSIGSLSELRRKYAPLWPDGILARNAWRINLRPPEALIFTTSPLAVFRGLYATSGIASPEIFIRQTNWLARRALVLGKTRGSPFRTCDNFIFFFALKLLLALVRAPRMVCEPAAFTAIASALWTSRVSKTVKSRESQLTAIWVGCASGMA